MNKQTKIIAVIALLVGGAIAVYFLYRRGALGAITDAEDTGDSHLWGGDGIGFAGFVNLFKSRKDATPAYSGDFKSLADPVPVIVGSQAFKTKADPVISIKSLADKKQ